MSDPGVPAGPSAHELLTELREELANMLALPLYGATSEIQQIELEARARWIRDLLPKLAAAVRPSETPGFDMLAHLRRPREFSERTFGPGARTKGVIDHIRKELIEIETDPTDISEWIDVTILALDGAWRAGYQPQQIIDALVAKQTKNEARVWPDWRTLSADVAIEHDRQSEPPAARREPR